MTKHKSSKERATTFRVPADVYAKMREISQVHRRSVNSEVIVALEYYLAAHAADLLPPAPRDDADE